MTDDVSLVVAFSAGLLSFLSPCVLSLVPVYLASLHGPEMYDSKAAGPRMPVFRHSVSFIVGFSVVFISLGAMAGLTGYAVRLGSVVLARIAGSLLIVFGLFMLASLKVPWLNYEKRLAPPIGKTTGYLRSFLVGAVFSLGWTACIGPILAGILALASVRATAWQGAYLLSAYSLGLGLPFLVMGAAFDSVSPLLRRVRPYSWIVSVVSALLLITVGALVLTNHLTRIFSLLA